VERFRIVRYLIKGIASRAIGISITFATDDEVIYVYGERERDATTIIIIFFFFIYRCYHHVARVNTAVEGTDVAEVVDAVSVVGCGAG